MKRIIKSLAIAAVSVLAFISCSQEQNPVSKDNGIHFTIRTSENPQVKSFIDNNLNGTYTPKWSKDDKLAIFIGTIDENTKPTATLTNISETGLTAYFDGQVTGIGKDGTFKSFAPAKAFATGYSNGNVGITLAETQKPSSLTIDQACDILVAKEASYMADATTGEVTIDDLYFKRMFSIVKVALKGPESLNGEIVSKFSLTAPERTILTGRAAINLSSATIDKWNISNNTVTATYTTDAPGFGGEHPDLDNVVWFVVNPGTIEPGAKVVFAGETANYTFTKEVTLSKALTFPESQLAVINLTLAEENCTKKEVPAPASWIATDLADITATDEVVITMAKGGKVYAMTSDNGTKNPQAVLVTVKDGELSATPADNLVWNIANDKGNLTIYPKGQTDEWLCSVSGETDVKVSNSTTCKIFTLDPTTKYLKNTGSKRYLGVSNSQDWRCYASTGTLAGQTLCFYVKGGPIDNTIPTLSVDQTSKVWAADATDGFVVKVTVNSEGGDWNVNPTTLDWASITVNKTAGTITITPNGANTNETANEATLTITHASDASIKAKVSLKQNGKGGAAGPTTVTKTISDMSGNPGDGTQVSSMAMDDVITLSASTDGNNGKVYKKGTEWRLYQFNNGTMTVSSKAGYVIESITVTFTVSNKGALLYNNTAVASGKPVSVSGSSVIFTLGNTSTAKNGQIIITAISVTYKQQ